ncbi:hypothetical protein [Bradyrhizobium sp. LB11.1]|uniref:hypothetical protein n=1 Tax=Bradyrhizobium sp. LB11.1 TaxID=3156326 RepID=UPI003391D6F5
MIDFDPTNAGGRERLLPLNAAPYIALQYEIAADLDRSNAGHGRPTGRLPFSHEPDK